MQTFQVDRPFRNELAFSPDGRALVVGSRPFARIDPASGRIETLWVPEIESSSTSFSFVDGGNAIAFAIYRFNEGFLVRTSDTGLTRQQRVGNAFVSALVAHPRAGALFVAVASLDDEGAVRSYALAPKARGKTFFKSRRGAIDQLVISADGRWLAGSARSAEVFVWRLDGDRVPARVTATVSVPKPAPLIALSASDPKPAPLIALSADGARLAVVGSFGVAVRDILKRKEAFRSTQHRRAVTAVAYNPTKPVLTTGDVVGNVFLWDHTGRVLTRYDWGLDEVYGLAFAPDGLRCAAVDAAGKVVIWDVDV
jgi:WD40 repeat protein